MASRILLGGLAIFLVIGALMTSTASAQVRVGAPASRVGRVGYAVGVAAGVAVTTGLRALPRWNRPVTDARGAQVGHVPGTTRIGDHSIRERHRAVLGPRIAARARQMQPGFLKRFVAGVGAGATRAPGITYRLEARTSEFGRAVDRSFAAQHRH